MTCYLETNNVFELAFHSSCLLRMKIILCLFSPTESNLAHVQRNEENTRKMSVTRKTTTSRVTIVYNIQASHVIK